MLPSATASPLRRTIALRVLARRVVVGHDGLEELAKISEPLLKPLNILRDQRDCLSQWSPELPKLGVACGSVTNLRNEEAQLPGFLLRIIGRPRLKRLHRPVNVSDLRLAQLCRGTILCQ